VTSGRMRTVLLLTAGLLAAGSPALAQPAAATPSGPPVPAITHPQDDYAGSQIARHEGTASPQDRPQALPALAAGSPAGMDVSSHQGNVNWGGVSGASFAYVKATEGSTYTNPYFAQQYNGSYGIGLAHGAYHFATPNTADGATQANFFVDHGGGWSADGRTLPPALDLEYNPYGATCYGMTPAALVSWTHAFVNQVKARTGRTPAIYTSTSWWSQCMGGDASFGADPLWIPRYGSSVGALPPGWSAQTIWQYADSGAYPGDQDVYNGSAGQLQAFVQQPQ
jgi:GH25 family lysozyme M1 (1,4-beta-N-acetylmuramidase)